VSPSKGKRPTTGKGRAKVGKGGGAKGGPARLEAQRLAALVLGVLFIALFAIVAIAEGVGSPSIPSGAIAVLEEVPDGTGAPFEKPYTDCNGKQVTQDLSVVTEGEYDCAFKQLAAGSGLKSPPKPGDEQYDALREAAIATLTENIWLQSLGAEEGITVTVKDIEEEEEGLIKKSFEGSQKKFQEFLTTSGYTKQDVNERLKVQFISQELAKPLEEQAADAKPSSSEISDAYDAEKATRFTQPETRDIRILINKDKTKVEEGKAALEKDDSEASWKKVIKKYAESPATASTGGLQPGVTEEQYAGPVGEAMFSAPKGKIEGPFKYTLGELVFEVEKTTPETVRPLGEAEAEIKTELEQKSKEAIFTGYIEGFRSKWRTRTYCASDFTIEKTCSNFKGSPKNEEADPSCFEEVEKSKKEEEAEPPTPETEGCPAPVLQAKPALPGTITIVAPKGIQLAQRPYPPGLEETPAVPSLGGLTPSEVPTSP
jgi:parvulin-like peptidyl-prolyl isomerase